MLARRGDRLRLNGEFVVRSMRRTALTRLGEAGVDAFTLRRSAEHASISTTQRYVHPSDHAMEAAFERLQVAQGGHLVVPPARKHAERARVKIVVSRSKKVS